MIAAEVIRAFKARGWKLATAESCTGGMIGAALTDVPGSSAVLDRGFITYSNAAKIQMLGVQPSTLAAHGAVSEEIALEMARGALDRSDADVAISVTGIAGPGGSENKPEGRVCFALATTNGAQAETAEFGAIGRGDVRGASVAHAFAMLLRL